MDTTKYQPVLVGDVVRLRSGGPDMVARALWLDGTPHPDGSTEGCSVMVACTWQNEKGQERGAVFCDLTLNIVKTPDKKTEGRFAKYLVRRIDGTDAPGYVHEDSDYFVLDLTNDPFALDAAQTYVEACGSEYPFLAAALQSTIHNNRKTDTHNADRSSPAEEPEEHLCECGNTCPPDEAVNCACGMTVCPDCAEDPINGECGICRYCA